MALQRRPIELPFPFKGLDEGWAFRRQPAGTTPEALNVRPYDGQGERLRGGQRDGISKYFEAAVNGTNRIQSIHHLVTGLDPDEIQVGDAEFTDNFTQDDGVLDDTHWYRLYGTRVAIGSQDCPALAISELYPLVASNALTTTGITNYKQTSGIIKDSLSLSGVYVLEAYFRGPGGVNGGQGGFIVRAPDASAGLDANSYGYFFLELSAHPFNYCYRVGDTKSFGTLNATDFPEDYFDDLRRLQLRVNGNNFRFYVENTKIVEITSSDLSSNTNLGFMFARVTADDSAYDTFKVYTGVVPAIARTSKILVVSGGDFFKGTPTDGLTKATGGDDAFHATDPIGIQQAYGEAFCVDGLYANCRVYHKAGVDELAAWTPDSGTLPRGTDDATLGCKYITLYRGRVVLWGLTEDPQNWFMSAAGDPYDWDYSVDTATAAVAGNNSDAGKLGDLLTCFAPYSDDFAIMGGDHTLWMLVGDPASGGRIDNISYRTGIASAWAYAFDSSGVFYFFGSGTLWRMSSAQTAPEPISRGRMDSVFGAIDPAQFYTRLLWDDMAHGLHLFFTPVNQPDTAPYHYWWDARTNSFWQDQYPAAVGPTAVFLYDADIQNDRAVLLGGFDSYIRRTDYTAKNDDETKIISRADIILPPPMGDMANGRLAEILPILSSDSDGATLKVYGEETVEAAVNATIPRYIRTLIAGRNSSLRQRITANAFRLRLENDTVSESWALESLSGLLISAGKTRKGHL